MRFPAGANASPIAAIVPMATVVQPAVRRFHATIGYGADFTDEARSWARGLRPRYPRSIRSSKRVR